jgi:hypothetical protein
MADKQGYKCGPAPKNRQVTMPTSAPRHLLAPGTKPPMVTKMSMPKHLEQPTPAPKQVYQHQGGRKGGNEASS